MGAGRPLGRGAICGRTTIDERVRCAVVDRDAGQLVLMAGPPAGRTAPVCRTARGINRGANTRCSAGLAGLPGRQTELSVLVGAAGGVLENSYKRGVAGSNPAAPTIAILTCINVADSQCRGLGTAHLATLLLRLLRPHDLHCFEAHNLLVSVS